MEVSLVKLLLQPLPPALFRPQLRNEIVLALLMLAGLKIRLQNIGNLLLKLNYFLTKDLALDLQSYSDDW